MFNSAGCAHLMKVHDPDDYRPDEEKEWICPLCGTEGVDITSRVTYQDVRHQFHKDCSTTTSHRGKGQDSIHFYCDDCGQPIA